MQILEIYNNGNNTFTYWFSFDEQVYAVKINHTQKQSELVFNNDLTKQIYIKFIKLIATINNGELVLIDVKSLRQKYCNKNNTERKYIALGTNVLITLKNDQRTDKRVYGHVKKLLTSKPYHSRGIKVMLTNGDVGRVQAIIK